MAASKWTDADRDTALALIRDGLSYREINRRTGVPLAYLSDWAKHAGVTVDTGQVDAATTATRLKWAERRATLADEIGAGLGRLLDKALDADNGSDARGFAIAFGTLLDKAQLVTGGVTSRHEQLDAQRRRERVEGLADELEQRRQAKDGTTGG